MAGLGRADRDLVGLTVLALLLQGPRHTYDMQRQIVDTHKDFVTGLPRSMYHAVTRLSRDGLITAVETTRDAGRPERTLYRLTDAGRDELRARVRRLLRTPDPDTTVFVAALSYLGCLPVAEACDALERRAEALAASADGIRAQLDRLGGALPRLLLIEAEYELARVAGERDWVRALLADLRGGALSWPEDLAALLPTTSIPGEPPMS
ncbi:helix-turn-helix transcriptional regulator [Amycolatopsis samaneae]